MFLTLWKLREKLWSVEADEETEPEVRKMQLLTELVSQFKVLRSAAMLQSLQIAKW